MDKIDNLSMPQPTHSSRLLAPPRHTLTLFGIVAVLVVSGTINASHGGSGAASDPSRMLKNDLVMTGMLWFWAYFIFKGMREYGQSIRQFFGERWLTVPTLAGDAMVGALALVVIYGCTSGTHALLPHAAIDNPLLTATPRGAAGVMAWIVVSVSAGICEEIVFRGYLQRQLVAMTGNAALAIVVQAVAFGAGHSYEGLTSVVAIVLHGLLLGLVAQWRGNIRAGIVEHAGWDLLAGFGVIGANW
jgi:membrane protease YdiL (CAAX protease family)